jgi:hypothetical protein
MAGIDLGSVISMMNAAASDSQRAAGFMGAPALLDPEKLKKIKEDEDGKRAFDDATGPSATSRVVDPQAQVQAIQGMDPKMQNYAMQAFNIINGRATT